VPWESYTFQMGAHIGKRLDKVSDRDLRTLEGMLMVQNTLTGSPRRSQTTTEARDGEFAHE
jgi:hypothetical protein